MDLQISVFLLFILFTAGTKTIVFVFNVIIQQCFSLIRSLCFQLLKDSLAAAISAQVCRGALVTREYVLMDFPTAWVQLWKLVSPV